MRWTWVIGAALAATAGVFAGMDTSMHPISAESAVADVRRHGAGRHRQADGGDRGEGSRCRRGGAAVTYTWLGPDPLMAPSYKSAVAFFVVVLLLMFRRGPVQRTV